MITLFKPKTIQGQLPFDDCNMHNWNKIFEIDANNTKIARKNGQDYWLWDTSELQTLILATQLHDGVTRHPESARILGVLFKFTDDEIRSVILDALNGKFNYKYEYSKYDNNIWQIMRYNDYDYFSALMTMYCKTNSMQIIPFSENHIPFGAPKPNYYSKLNDDNSITKNFYTDDEINEMYNITKGVSEENAMPIEELFKKIEEEYALIRKNRHEK